MKYPMTKNTDRPMFAYIVMQNGEFDYYLYDPRDFDAALKKAMEISMPNEIGLIYELAFNNESREYRVQNTFQVFEGKVHYDKHSKVGLHVNFYVNAGQWLNPNEEWLKTLNSK